MENLLFAPAALLAVVTAMCGIVSILVERREAARRLLRQAPARRPFRPVVISGGRDAGVAPAHSRAAQTPLRSSLGAALNDNAARSTFG